MRYAHIPFAILVGFLPAYAADSLEHKVRRAVDTLYFHGVTESTALEAVGTEGVPILLKMLDDPAAQHRDNVVAFLAWLADDAAVDSLTRLSRTPVATRLTPAEDRAWLLVPDALAEIGRRGGTRAKAAVDAMAAGSDPTLVERARRALEPRATPARSAVAGEPQPAKDDSARSHALGLTYAVHPDASPAPDDASVDAALAFATRLAGIADGSSDVACCIRTERGASRRSFGAVGDGLDVVDDEAEMTRVGDDATARVKVVREIRWCGISAEPGFNILGCAEFPGDSMVVVSMGYASGDGSLWIHEYGHNAGLPHVDNPSAIMFYAYTGSNATLSAAECAAFHAPAEAAAMTPVDIGACTDDGDAFAEPIDNCPSVPNNEQWNDDQDSLGNACDNCPWHTNPGQEDEERDGVGDVCDRCPGFPNPGNADTDWDGKGDACDPCPLDRYDDWDLDSICDTPDNCVDVQNPDQVDADGDGLGDRCDRCAADPLNDDDLDGLCGSSDNCVDRSNRSFPGPFQDGTRTFGDLAFGDLDGDGFSDPVFGSSESEVGGPQSGAVFVHRGTPSSASTIPSSTLPGPVPGARMSVGSGKAGDFDGDGYDDLTTWIPGGDAAGPRLRIHRGGAAGAAPSPAWELDVGTYPMFRVLAAVAADVNGDGYDDVVASSLREGAFGRLALYPGSPMGLSATAAWTFETGVAASEFGADLDAAGDVNGDGFEDLVVGEPGWPDPDVRRGRAWVFFGGSNGLDATRAWTFDSGPDRARTGTSVAGAGDVNGDGFDDLLVGAPELQEAPHRINRGRAHLFLGSSAGLPASPSTTIGADPYCGAGRELAGAGDVNGDGFADVLIASACPTGMANLFPGTSLGLSTAPLWMGSSPYFSGTYPWSLQSAGDVDADGFADFLVRGPSYLVWPQPAFVYLYRGGPTGPLETQADEDADGSGDRCDNCPAIANPDQANGDYDAHGDACDPCPNDGLNDSDLDGLCSVVDNCDYVPNADQADADGDTVGDACDACVHDALNDRDGDGRCADADNCPASWNYWQEDWDADGRGDVCETGASRADIDLSGRVDGVDLVRFGRGFGAIWGSAAFDLGCDLNADTRIDGDDLALFAAEFGKRAP